MICMMLFVYEDSIVFMMLLLLIIAVGVLYICMKSKGHPVARNHTDMDLQI